MVAVPLLPAIAMLSAPPVPLTETWSACPSRSEVEVEVADAGSGQIVDVEAVGARERGDVDLLGAGGAHRDAAAAGERQRGPVRREATAIAAVEPLNWSTVAAEAVHRDRDGRGLAPARVTSRRAGDGCSTVAAGHRDQVVGVRAVGDHLVGWPSVPRSTLTSDVGSGEVVDGDHVGAAERVDVDPLDAVRVHRDVGRRRGRTAAGCRWPTGRPCSATLAPLNSIVSLPGCALDRVAAVARIPVERVVASAHRRRRCRGCRRSSRCRRRRASRARAAARSCRCAASARRRRRAWSGSCR